MTISVSFHYVYGLREQKPNITFSIWSDDGKAPRAQFSDPNTGSDVTHGKETLLNFTEYCYLNTSYGFTRG